jgi:2-keto-4-pentenoate hydratase/2-oxohepta-3-ene-1,7-dioic acid hydratase in catechol pathway
MVAGYRLAVADSGTGSGAPGAVFVERDGKVLPLTALLDDEDLRSWNGQAPQDLMPLLADWDRWAVELPRRLGKADASAWSDASSLTFRPPVARPNKLICIGANYHDHIEEMKIPVLPSYPYSFLKPASTTLRGSGEAVNVPTIAKLIDWEAELAVIIGKRARNVAAADALSIVAGYANFNDLSARDWLANRPAIGVDWVRHKAFDGFAPFGPYFVPSAFVPDPQALPVKLTVNGVVKQSSNTSKMIFGVVPIIEHLSSIMTLEPGDVIATGTPAGTGFGLNPQEFLKAGDVVRIEIGGLGVLETPMV